MTVTFLLIKRAKTLAKTWYPVACVVGGLLVSLASLAFVRGQKTATEESWRRTTEAVIADIQKFQACKVAESVSDRQALHDADVAAQKASAVRFESLSVDIAQIKGTLSQVDANVTRLLNQRVQAVLPSDRAITMRASPAGPANQ